MHSPELIALLGLCLNENARREAPGLCARKEALSVTDGTQGGRW
jgi:hypothetical protein